MDNSKLALLLGMLCGDGCLSIHTKKQGYKTYSTGFFNSDLNLVKDFDYLFLEVFGVKGNFHPEIKEGKKIAYAFRSYSKEVFNKIASFGFPIGVKKNNLRIPEIILNSGRKEKILFIKGIIITDGSIRKQGSVLFHMASKSFLEDLSKLIFELFGLKKEVKEYLQREKYLSYQLFLDKGPSQEVLSLKM